MPMKHQCYPTGQTMSLANVGSSSILIAPTEGWRMGLGIYNTGGNIVYVAFGATCDPNGFVTLRLNANEWWISSLPIYRGPISAVRGSGSGIVSLTKYYLEKIATYY